MCSAVLAQHGAPLVNATALARQLQISPSSSPNGLPLSDQYLISTVAGNFGPIRGRHTPINPSSSAADAAGNLYIIDEFRRTIVKFVPSTGAIDVVAGNGDYSYVANEGMQATSVGLGLPRGLAVDAAGDLLIADAGSNRIRKVSFATGMMTSIAGNGGWTFDGDGGPASSAALWDPWGVALNSAGDVFISDSANARIRMVSSGTITTVAGTGNAGFSGDGSPGPNAMINRPYGIAVSHEEHVLFVDSGNNRVRLLNMTSGIIISVVGTGPAAYGGDGGSATNAFLYNPSVMAFDATGGMFIAEKNRIRFVSALRNYLHDCR